MKELLLWLIIFPSILFSQERVNRENLEFHSKIGQLDKAIGWSFNKSTGDWVDFQNLISDKESYKDNGSIIASKTLMSHNENNFLNLEFRDLIYKDKTYYILMVTKWNGRYEYPSIYRGWIIFKQLKAFIYTPEEFEKLKNLKEGEKVVLKTGLEISTHIDSKYSEEDPLDRIQYVLDNNSSYFEYEFPVIISNEGKVRFFLPDHYSSYEDPYDLNKEYFEIDKEAFGNFFGHKI